MSRKQASQQKTHQEQETGLLSGGWKKISARVWIEFWENVWDDLHKIPLSMVKFRNLVQIFYEQLSEFQDMSGLYKKIDPLARSQRNNYIYALKTAALCIYEGAVQLNLPTRPENILNFVWLESRLGFFNSMTEGFQLLTEADALGCKENQNQEHSPEDNGGKSTTKTEPQKIEGEWSRPMMKTEIMKALGIDSYKKLKTFGKFQPIRNAGSKKLWQINFDGLNKEQIEKLKKV